MYFGNTLWIANNDDDDTLLQKAYLDTFAINDFTKLKTHVDTYQCALARASHKYETGMELNASNFSSTKGKLLFHLGSYGGIEEPTNSLTVPSYLAPPKNKVANLSYEIKKRHIATARENRLYNREIRGKSNQRR